jgi:hypothetical protein
MAHDVNQTINVLVVDDHELVHRGLLAILDGEPDIEIVGDVDGGGPALEQMALDLVFNANAVVELGAAAPLSPRELRSAADELKRQADRLSALLGPDDRALRFARLVLEGLEHELDRALIELPTVPEGPGWATDRR